MEGEKVKRRREGMEQERKGAVGEKGKGGTEGVVEEGRDGKKGEGTVGVKRYGRREGAVEKGSGWGGGKG